MGNSAFGYPVFSDVNGVIAPTLAGGSWVAGLPLANLQDTRSKKVARSSTAARKDTRFHMALLAARRVGIVALPYHNLSAGSRVRVLARNDGSGSFMFDYEAGDDIATMGGTFTRATTATYKDKDGALRIAAVGALRDAHFPVQNGRQCTRNEPLRVNLVTSPNDLTPGAGWTTTGTTTVVAAFASIGDVTLSRISNVGGGGVFRTVALTGNGTKAVSGVVQFDVAGVQPIALYDATAAAFRGRILVTWAADGTATAIADSGGTLKYFRRMYANTYEFSFAATGTIAANTNRIYGSDSGASSVATARVGCLQVEDATWSTSFIPNGTRNAEVLSFAGFTYPMNASTTYYIKYYENFDHVTGAVYYLSVGTVNPVVQFAADIGATYARATNAVPTNFDSVITTGTAALPAIGDSVELMGVLALAGANGTMTQSRSVNAGVVLTAAPSGSFAVPAAYGSSSIQLSSLAAESGADFESVRIMSGVRTMADMRAMTYDSGWIDVWPVAYPPGILPANDPRVAGGLGLSAEERAVTQVGWTHVLTAPFLCTAASIQIDDALNPATFVDVGRLMIMGIYEPSINIDEGAKMPMITSTTRDEMDGGSFIFDPKPVRREYTFTLGNHPIDELLVNSVDMIRRIGTSGQFFFVFDKSDTYHMHRRSFPCFLKELTPMEYPYFGRGSVPFAVSEWL